MYLSQSIVAACSTDSSPVLEQEIAELQRIIDHKFPQYDNDDPLDLGEACWLAHWFPEEEWSQASLLHSASGWGILPSALSAINVSSAVALSCGRNGVWLQK